MSAHLNLDYLHATLLKSPVPWNAAFTHCTKLVFIPFFQILYSMEDHLLEGLSSPLYLVPQIIEELLAREQVPAVR